MDMSSCKAFPHPGRRHSAAPVIQCTLVIPNVVRNFPLTAGPPSLLRGMTEGLDRAVSLALHKKNSLLYSPRSTTIALG